MQDELKTNVALRVETVANSEKFIVSGRGELHLSILIENMRREGFELAVSRAEVIVKTQPDGTKEEPYEHLVIDVDGTHQGAVIEQLGLRKATMREMQATADGRVRIDILSLLVVWI